MTVGGGGVSPDGAGTSLRQPSMRAETGRTRDPGEKAEPAPPRGAALWRRWFAAATLGEVVGFSAPALVGPAAMGGTAPDPLGFIAMVAAGTVEGAVLGTAQSLALSRALPSLRRRDWTLATAAGAAVAWSIALPPATMGDRLVRLPAVLVVVGGTALGLALLASMGVLQWTVLRRHVRNAAWWVPATAGAWLAGLTVFFALAMPLWQEGQPLALVAAIGVLAGLAMAATAAALTGAALVRLLGPPGGD